ncbi:MAG: hypothetical protein ACXVC7_03730 [Bacteroidia bacterium]
MKTTIKFLVAACIIMLGSQAKAGSKNISDSTICLELSGRISKLKPIENNYYHVELIYNGIIVDSMKVKDNKDFKFALKKNTIYGIRISKPGYYSRIISINTSTPGYANAFFRFEFDTDMIRIDDAAKINKDALDFPIAVISFNEDLRAFYYNEEYTTYIKRRIYLGEEF